MKHAGSIIGFLAPLAAPVRYKKRRTPIRIGGGRGNAPAPRNLPWGFYKARVTRTHTNDPPETYPLHCYWFKYCDQKYQELCPEQRDAWRRGIKRPRISPYDLFMSECLKAAHQRWPVPDGPSISGGFTTKHVRPGTKIPCPPVPPSLRPRSKIDAAWLRRLDPPRDMWTRLFWHYTPEPPPPSPEYDRLWVWYDWNPHTLRYNELTTVTCNRGYLNLYAPLEPNDPVQLYFTFTYPDGVERLYAYLTINQPWAIERFDQHPWLPPPQYPEEL